MKKTGFMLFVQPTSCPMLDYTGYSNLRNCKKVIKFLPVLSRYHKRGENRTRFQSNSHFEYIRVIPFMTPASLIVHLKPLLFYTLQGSKEQQGQGFNKREVGKVQKGKKKLCRKCHKAVVAASSSHFSPSRIKRMLKFIVWKKKNLIIIM